MKLLTTTILFALGTTSVYAALDDQGQWRERFEQRAAEARAKFDAADANGDGGLDRNEAAALSDKLVTHFDRVDFNADQRLQLQEIVQVRREMRAARHAARIRFEGLKLRFAALDRDGDLALTPVEIGDKMPRVAEHFQQIDADRNGKVTVEEIRTYAKAKREERRAQGAS